MIFIAGRGDRKCYTVTLVEIQLNACVRFEVKSSTIKHLALYAVGDKAIVSNESRLCGDNALC